MFPVKFINKLQPQIRCLCLCHKLLDKTPLFKDDPSIKADDFNKKTSPVVLGDMGSKYQTFRDVDATEILDIYEETSKYGDLLESDTQIEDRFGNLNLERGLSGVFEIEDLVEVLHHENAQNIFVASVPKEVKYVDYICIVSGKSSRHMKGIAQFVKKVYKQKRNSTDTVPRIEGKGSNDWLALDLGNIALHIFSPEARALYDLDTLWAVGPQYDPESNKEDPIAEMLEKHSIYLDGLKPAT